jgi:hypothetical protein
MKEKDRSQEWTHEESLSGPRLRSSLLIYTRIIAGESSSGSSSMLTRALCNTKMDEA